MSNSVKKTGVHLIYNEEGLPIAFFMRNETTGENTVFIVAKASLEDIEELMTISQKKV